MNVLLPGAGLAVAASANSIVMMESLDTKSDSTDNIFGKNMHELRDSCVSSLKELKNATQQAMVAGTDAPDTLTYANNLINACRDLENIDLEQFDNPAVWSAVLSGIGAGTAAAGIGTNIGTRIAKHETAEKLQNTTNILAGVSTAASASATILNAKRVSNMKTVVEITEKCNNFIEDKKQN